MHRFENLFRRGRRQIEVVVHVVPANGAVVLHQASVDFDHLHVGPTDTAFGQQLVDLLDAIAAPVRILAAWQQRLNGG